MAENEEDMKTGAETETLPPEVAVETAPAGEPQKPAELTPEEGVADLKAKLEAATRAQAEAQQREAHARQVAAQAQAHAGSSQLEMLAGSISQAQQNLKILQGRYAQLMAEGDHNGASEVMTATAAWTNHLQQLQQGKTALEQQLRQPAPQPVQQNPVEAMAASLSPASAAWLRSHPEAIRNIEALRGAHAIAMTKHAHESQGYFAEIEHLLGIASAQDQGRAQSQPQNRVEVPTGDNAMSAAAQPVSQRQGAPPAAPVSRSGNGRVRLTPEQVEAAEISGMTPEEYYEAQTNPDRYRARQRQKANGRATTH